MEGRECKSYTPAVPEGRHDDQNLTCQQPRKRTNKKIMNKKRFSDEQIKSLESIFESDTRLEPRKKVQLARELGLQPRQVAIWFQNRRARWKSKYIEQEYRTLRDNYENLASQFESLKKEKQSLLIQLQNLGDLLGENHDGNGESSSKGLEGNSTVAGRSDDGSSDSETKAKSSCLQKGMEHKGVMFPYEEENGVGSFGGGGHGFLNMNEPHGPLASLDEGYSTYDSGGLLDHLCSSSYWLNSWS
ncbi:hypothetical protein F2P56_035301 [Juglans regia]|uniref:Homeobox-leucine zipper protein n=2 Tax=Juglans regia TaxID=51240 RepID=A0A2I4GFX1_JUGRE|nr:homeobox-leucine zipper protein ATHB-12-like [Juglans regia]KAF5442668.1 hypothetical protein F2P56_035301 [Juglans regia]